MIILLYIICILTYESAIKIFAETNITLLNYGNIYDLQINRGIDMEFYGNYVTQKYIDYINEYENIVKRTHEYQSENKMRLLKDTMLTDTKRIKYIIDPTEIDTMRTEATIAAGGRNVYERKYLKYKKKYLILKQSTNNNT